MMPNSMDKYPRKN